MTDAPKNDQLLEESVRYGWSVTQGTSSNLIIERCQQFLRVGYGASGLIRQIDAGVYNDQDKHVPYATYCSYRGRDRRGFALELLAQPESAFGAAWPRRDAATARGWRWDPAK